MDAHIIAAVFAVLVGLCIGSFLNVCIHRLPLGRSIISPPSACPGCGARVRFYDNIPVLSFLILRGRCRDCRRPIGWQYPLVEVLTALLSLGLYLKFDLTLSYPIYFVFGAALVLISFIDLEHRIIPDIISLGGIPAGFAAALLLPHIGILTSLIGALAGGGSLFLVAFVYERLTGRMGLGGGDIKLLAMIGAWMGWQALPLIVLMASLSGAVTGLGFILASGQGLRTRIPFGPFLALGALAYLFYGPAITQMYLGLLR